MPKKNPARKIKKYSVSGNSLKKEGKSCPKCGEGIFLAQHKDRVYCGTCHYTEFSKN